MNKDEILGYDREEFPWEENTTPKRIWRINGTLNFLELYLIYRKRARKMCWWENPWVFGQKHSLSYYELIQSNYSAISSNIKTLQTLLQQEIHLILKVFHGLNDTPIATSRIDLEITWSMVAYSRPFAKRLCLIFISKGSIWLNGRFLSYMIPKGSPNEI